MDGKNIELHRESYLKKKRIGRPSDFPEGPHLAIIDFGSIYIPGDERSRTHPGHGYPASTETTVEYIVWKIEDRHLWEYEITEREKDHKSYIALDNGRKVTVKPKFSISVD